MIELGISVRGSVLVPDVFEWYVKEGKSGGRGNEWVFWKIIELDENGAE